MAYVAQGPSTGSFDALMAASGRMGWAAQSGPTLTFDLKQFSGGQVSLFVAMRGLQPRVVGYEIQIPRRLIAVLRKWLYGRLEILLYLKLRH